MLACYPEEEEAGAGLGVSLSGLVGMNQDPNVKSCKNQIEQERAGHMAAAVLFHRELLSVLTQ